MSISNWLTNLYVNTKRTIKSTYHMEKVALMALAADSDSDLYKYGSKAVNIAEPIFSGITETAEFVVKNLGETGAVLGDLAGWAIGSETLNTKRLLNYLYNYSRETGSDVKLLLNEIPAQSLSDVLKYVNNTISEKKKIPCSQTCMDIALSNPKNIRTAEYQTVNNEILNTIVKDKKVLSKAQQSMIEEDLPLVQFKENGQHARMLQENDKMQKKLREWANLPEDKRPKSLVVALDAKSDPKNGYDSYATFHNVSVLNPTVDDAGNIHGYVFDVYDFERASFNGQMLDFATIMAYHLQETGHLENYKILVPITIPAEEVKAN